MKKKVNTKKGKANASSANIDFSMSDQETGRSDSIRTPYVLSELKKMMLIVIAVFSLALYANTLKLDYACDDHVVIFGNKIVTKGISAIPEILRTGYMKGFWDKKENSYRPASLIMFAIEWQLAPGKPFIGHLVNVLLYVLTGIMLFLTLLRLLPKQNLIIPLITTLLFIAHPVHTEVVANIKSRDEILCFLFLILSLWFLTGYISLSRKPKIISLLSALLFFFLALLSKENAITGLAIVPLVLYFFTSVNVKKIVVVTAQYTAMAGVYLLIRRGVLQGLTSESAITVLNNSLVAAPDLMSRFATAVYIMGKYLGLLFFPHPLIYNYAYNQIKNIPITDAKALIPLVVYIALIIYALKTFLQKNLKAFGILFFLITISLTSNIFFLIVSPMGERFLYTPSLGFCIAIAILITELFKTDVIKNNIDLKGMLKNNKGLFILTIIVLVLFSFKTISRNSDWKNDLTLVENDLKYAPESESMHYAYGSTILFDQAMKENDPVKKSKLLDDAFHHLEKCVSIYNYNPDALLNLGIACKERKDTANAIKYFDLAGKYESGIPNIDFYIRLGDSYHELKNGAEADKYYELALQIDPDNKFILNNYASYLADRGDRLDEAAMMAKNVLIVNPQDPVVMDTYGWVLYKQNKYTEAKEWIGKALNSGFENNGSALEHYGDVLFRTDDTTAALNYWQKAKVNHVQSATIDEKIKNKRIK